MGSQKQPSKMPNTSKTVVTIQDEVEKAISTLTKTKTKTIFSGRTDAGVHAKGQTAHFESEQELNPSKFVNSLNGILPNDISVKELRKIEKTFHAQKSAKARHYRYTIANRTQRSAWDGHCLLVRYPLDIERMNKALSYLIGEHDFTSFKKVRTSNPAKICNMYEAKATRDGDLVYIDFTADRFLYNMIRLIVGTLLMIERNSLAPETLKEILEARDITKAGSTISPDGLTLVEVIYNNINGESK
jgi:tRNA pseudouridine38-40 synthase